MASSSPLVAKWQPPPDPFIKVNCDAAIYDSGWYQVASVGWDSAGKCVSWSIRKYRCSPSSVVAEACAARLDLHWAKTKGWDKVHLEEGCLQVIKALDHRNGNRLYSFGAVVSAFFNLFPCFEGFRCSFIPRVGNYLAQALAHFPLLNTLVLDGISPPADLARLL